ncbi:MAG: hypothetical protein MZU91_15225 [Desulfosudis oleivorans]|nr:hypothetical protein [Desulfosudis oleivorans]
MLADIGRYDPPGTEGLCQHEMQKPRNAAAENEHALSRLQPSEPLAAHNTGKGLDKYALIERDVVGQDEDPAVDIQGGDAQVLAEPPGS